MRLIALLLVLAFVAAPAAGLTFHRAVTEPYVAGPGDFTAVCRRDPMPVSVGGACFQFEPGDGAVRFVVKDDRFPRIKAGYVIGGGSEPVYRQGDFCSSTGTILAPAGAVRMAVFVNEVKSWLPGHCTLLGAESGTRGNVTAEFFR